MKYLLTLLLALGGCTATKIVKHTETIEVTKTTPIYYQAYDENWYSDPSINPIFDNEWEANEYACLLYTSPSPRDGLLSRMPSSA